MLTYTLPNCICWVFLVQVISEAVRTTLGPRGMDKLMVDGRGEEKRGDEDQRNELQDNICFTKTV